MAEVQRDNLGSREDTLRFIDMVGLFGNQAMIALGKVANPATQKAEPHLPVAQLFIDTLEMLERKTQGNLNKDEERILRATLTDLRLMYAEEVKSGAAAAPAAAKPTPPPETPPAPAPAAEPATEVPDPKVKFHKSYGEQ